MGLFFWKKNQKAEKIDTANLPRHIAVIMDGNGRWARKRGLPRSAGHAAGAETFRRVATYCRDIGISYLTVYAFSTENWRRPLEEVEAIMSLLEKYLREAIESMDKNRVKMKVFGDISVLPPRLAEMADEVNEMCERAGERFQANLCVNYGGRSEILRAAESWAKNAADSGFEGLTEEIFSGYLYSAGLADPDLIIRPSGEKRLSNFLLWQAAYSELYFSDKLWPDFTPADINAAIAEYQARNRRFGGIESQVSAD